MILWFYDFYSLDEKNMKALAGTGFIAAYLDLFVTLYK